MVIVISFQRFKRQSLKDQEYSFIQPFEMHLANLTQLTFNAKDMTKGSSFFNYKFDIIKLRYYVYHDRSFLTRLINRIPQLHPLSKCILPFVKSFQSFQSTAPRIINNIPEEYP